MPPRREGSALKTSESNKIEKKRISTKKMGEKWQIEKVCCCCCCRRTQFSAIPALNEAVPCQRVRVPFCRLSLSLNAVLSAERRHALKPPFLFLWATWPRHRPVPTRVQFNWQLKTLLKAANSLQRLPRNAAAKKSGEGTLLVLNPFGIWHCLALVSGRVEAALAQQKFRCKSH